MKAFLIALLLGLSLFRPANAMDLFTPSEVLAIDCKDGEIQIMLLVASPGIVHIGLAADACEQIQQYRRDEEDKFKDKTVPPALPQDDNEDSGRGEYDKS